MIKKVLKKINPVMGGRIDWCTEETGSKDSNQGGFFFFFLKFTFEVLMLKLENGGTSGK